MMPYDRPNSDSTGARNSGLLADRNSDDAIRACRDIRYRNQQNLPPDRVLFSATVARVILARNHMPKIFTTHHGVHP